jgi:type IV pilus assembly protein PilN
VVAVNGVAQTNERVSELLRNTLYNSAWLSKPESGRDQGHHGRPAANRGHAAQPPVRVLDAVTLKRPQAPAGCRCTCLGPALAAKAKSS